jgi:N-acetylneuraminic acid mutarotase
MSGHCGWITCFLSFNLLILMTSCGDQGVEKISLKWIQMPPVPPSSGETMQPGLAGPVAGALREYLLISGGANFLNGLPWKGAAKSYHDEIFLLKKSSEGGYEWRLSELKLPFKLAYSACVSIPGGIVSIGGENDSGIVKKVLFITGPDGLVSIQQLPDLPEAVTSGGAAFTGSKIYFAGGMNTTGATAGFYCLDLNSLGDGWEKLPDIPDPLSHAVMVCQQDESGPCIFVIGGRNKAGEVSTIHSSNWKYSLKSGAWSSAEDINTDGQLVTLSAGTGIAAGRYSIILFGGDKGLIFNQIERLNAAIERSQDPERQTLLNQKDSILTNHPGFSGTILSYNTLSRKWAVLGEMPGTNSVTTTAFNWDGKVIIPSGEVRPGIRTPNISGVEISISN